VRLRASSALHQGSDLCGTRESSSKWLICYSWKLLLPRRLGGGRIFWSSQEDCAWLRISCCERSCAHLTRAVKSNSSGVEVWSGSLVLTSSRSSGALIEEWWTLNPPQGGLGVTGKSSTPHDKIRLLCSVISYSISFQVLYLEHLLSRDWIVFFTLGCKPPI
jgi:hypothetical protein